MKHPVYSVGYTGLDLAAFEQWVRDTGVIVADLRLKPFSRNPTWNRSVLAKRLGARYEWIEELGNLNYKGGPITLKDAPAGLEKLRFLLRHSPVAVLCVCADPAVCHRTVVTKILEAEGYTVRPRTLAVSRGQIRKPLLF